MPATCTWEQAVEWLRGQSDRQDLVAQCYYDDPVEAAARRFHAASEWQATRELLHGHLPGAVLDVGAGRGIASYAFAVDGSRVTALEPDGSDLVGRGCIEALARRTGLPIRCAAGYGEGLPFAAGQFDVVYGRAVLHHARDLRGLMREVARVLRSGGMALFTREHVISRPGDLPAFLAGHALHGLYGGEHAYLLRDYTSACVAAGLRMRRVLGPWETAANYWPCTDEDVDRFVRRKLERRVGGRLASRCLRSATVRRTLRAWFSRTSREPGRLFSFLAVKP